MAGNMNIAETNLVDRLSDLPDSIIHHIFSFMDMDLVIQTSTLATRWRNLWACTPVLNFSFTCSRPSVLSSSDKEKRKCFKKFVNRVLTHQGASHIHRFSLSSQPSLNVDHLHTWLSGVLKRNVKELYLLSGANKPFELPPRIFTSDITVLTLSFTRGGGSMRLPNTICSAAKLKSLKLENVELPDGNSDGELTLSCPALESLSMEWCDDNNLKVFTISATVLKTLEFKTEPDYDSSCVMNICCPNLTSIMYTCYGSPYLSSLNLPSLVSAYINIWRDDTVKKKGYSTWLTTIFREISNASSLKLGAYTLRDIISSPSIFQILPSIFTNLRCITVEDFSDDDGRTSICAMANILKMFPSIKALVWDRTEFERDDDRHSDDDDDDDDEEEGDLQVRVILHDLETIEIRNPCGLKDELKFIRFLLEGAVSLKKLSIKLTEDKQYSKKFKRKLLALPRASTSALVHCP